MMMFKRIAALALAGALSLGAALAQSNPGTSPLSRPKGGTGCVDSPSCVKSWLGLVIGTNVQGWDADLDALAALTGTNTIYYRSATNTWTPVTIGGMLSFSAGTLNIGDAELTALAGLTSANNKCFYWTGSGTAALYDCSSFGRSVANAADAAALRLLAGSVIGTDVQAFDAELAAIAGLTSAANKVPYFTGLGTAALADSTSFGRGLWNLADASAGRTSLGVVIGTDVQAFDADLAALAANATDGLWAHTGAGTGAARTLAAPAAGLTIANPAGVAGNPTFALANDLAALEALASVGYGVRTTTDTWAQRTFQAGTGMGVTNGDGVSGNTSYAITDAELLAIAGLTSAADKCPYWTGSGTAANYDCGAYGRSLANAADASALRTLGGLVIGTNVQAWDADLDTWATKTAPSGVVVGTTDTQTLSGKSFTAPIVTGLADIQGAVKLSTQSAPAQITANQNNYNPGSVVCATSSTLLINSDAARDITGIAGGVAGCELRLVNNGSFAITLKEESGSSTAGNRFTTGGDISIASSAAVPLLYDGIASRWRLLGAPAAGGGGSGTVTSVACTDGIACSTITTSGTVKLEVHPFALGNM